MAEIEPTTDPAANVRPRRVFGTFAAFILAFILSWCLALRRVYRRGDASSKSGDQPQLNSTVMHLASAWRLRGGAMRQMSLPGRSTEVDRSVPAYVQRNLQGRSTSPRHSLML